MVLSLAIAAGIVLAQDAPTAGPYKVLKTAKVGGDGGFDYVYADDAGRRLYIARGGPAAVGTVGNRHGSNGSKNGSKVPFGL